MLKKNQFHFSQINIVKDDEYIFFFFYNELRNNE